MTASAQQFPYVALEPALGNAGLAPMLPLMLIGSQSVATTGLVDSGAAINVLPHALGLQLGFDWDKETRSVEIPHDRIIVDPDILVGKPVVKGTRLSVNFLLGRLAQGWQEAEILRNYPGLQREDLLACISENREGSKA
jgi:uncharacterized protein (DUF433 family)